MQTELSRNLNYVADVLEKTALYLDKLEVKEAKDKKEHLNNEYVNPVVEKISELMDYDLEDDVREKLSQTDPEILDLLKRTVMSNSEQDSVRLGGPSDTGRSKVASYNDSEDALLDFCLGE